MFVVVVVVGRARTRARGRARGAFESESNRGGTRDDVFVMSTPPPPKPWTAAKETGETARTGTPAADGNCVKPWDFSGAGSPPTGASTNRTEWNDSDDSFDRFVEGRDAFVRAR